MLAILVAVVALAGTVALGARFAFERRLAREIDGLLADARPAVGQTVTKRALEQLLHPVQRWLEYSQVVRTAVPTTVRLGQDGQFQMEGRGWMPFAAEQYFTIDPRITTIEHNRPTRTVIPIFGVQNLARQPRVVEPPAHLRS